MKQDDDLVKTRTLQALRADNRLGALGRDIDVDCSDSKCWAYAASITDSRSCGHRWRPKSRLSSGGSIHA